MGDGVGGGFTVSYSVSCVRKGSEHQILLSGYFGEELLRRMRGGAVLGRPHRVPLGYFPSGNLQYAPYTLIIPPSYPRLRFSFLFY